MRIRLDPEPCTIDADVVVEFLERLGRPGMAGFVRSLARRDTQAGLRDQQHRMAYDAIVERLHKYEPPPSRGVRDPVWTGD